MRGKILGKRRFRGPKTRGLPSQKQIDALPWDEVRRDVPSFLTYARSEERNRSEAERNSCLRRVWFPTEERCMDVARSMTARNGTPLRAYCCRVCHGWHMTKTHDRAPRLLDDAAP